MDLVRKNGLTENDVIEVIVRRKNAPLKELFGTLERESPTQGIKDELKEGWEE